MLLPVPITYPITVFLALLKPTQLFAGKSKYRCLASLALDAAFDLNALPSPHASRRRGARADITDLLSRRAGKVAAR